MEEKRYLTVQSDYHKVLVPVDDIMYLTVDGRKTKITRKDGSALRTNRSMKDIYAELPGEVFVEYGLYMKAMAGYGTVIVNELTNGCLPGYVYTPESLVTGGYETDTSMLREDFGMRMTELAIKTARTLKGKER